MNPNYVNVLCCLNLLLPVLENEGVEQVNLKHHKSLTVDEFDFDFSDFGQRYLGN